MPNGTTNILYLCSILEDQIKEGQAKDEEIQHINNNKSKVLRNKFQGLRSMNKEYFLCHENWICTVRDEKIMKLILDEAHYSTYSIPTKSTKAYMYLRQKDQWTRMKLSKADDRNISGNQRTKGTVWFLISLS